MQISFSHKTIFTAGMLFGLTFCASAKEPAGYYQKCINLSDDALSQAIHEVVGPHKDIGYGGLWTLYKTSDVRPNGKIWDMYSTKEWTYSKEQCGSYTVIGDCYNREHSMPKSWFSDAAPMVSDAFHIYPTDGKVNGQRSNYPYGECANGTSVAARGDIKPLGKLGACTFAGYNGTVFEPDDQYKGDFARSYFYMVTAYRDKVATWKSDMLAGNSFPALKSWSIELLLKWHRQDPVSEKELSRNEAVAEAQSNRNPFIDHPELAEYLWGDKKGERWQGSGETKAVINSPADGTTVSLGKSAVGVQRNAVINIRGTYLTKALTLTATGGYTVQPSTMQPTAANAEEGVNVTITVIPPAAGIVAGTLTISSSEVSSIVNLTTEAVNGLPVETAANITDESFLARWVYVGDAAEGKYTIDVKASGKSIDGYPRKVQAEAESYTVDGLEASTEYTYTLSSDHLTGAPVKVTTSAPIPDLVFVFDGEAFVTAEPGEPSAPIEIGYVAENMPAALVFTVAAPFEISDNKSNWSTSLTAAPQADRLYLRVNAKEEGNYESILKAVSGDYIWDEFVVKAKVGQQISFIEDFDNLEAQGDTKQDTYTDHPYIGKMAKWYFYNAGIWTADIKVSGVASVRFGKNSDSRIEMTTDKPNGAGKVTVQMAAWSDRETATVGVEFSTDGGANWQSAGSVNVVDTNFKPYIFTVNKPGDIRLRLAQSKGGRLNADDFIVEDFHENAGNVEPELYAWDAWSPEPGTLCISSDNQREIRVYSTDGIARIVATVTSGENLFSLPTGLYIVASGNHARRVVVK